MNIDINITQAHLLNQFPDLMVLTCNVLNATTVPMMSQAEERSGNPSWDCRRRSCWAILRQLCFFLGKKAVFRCSYFLCLVSMSDQSCTFLLLPSILSSPSLPTLNPTCCVCGGLQSSRSAGQLYEELHRQEDHPLWRAAAPGVWWGMEPTWSVPSCILSMCSYKNNSFG